MEQLVAGRFAIEREAGAGAMARVYRARDTTTDAPVAVKVINAVGEYAMRRFAREVGALEELAHPHIVRYIAHGTTQSGHAFLAMEWLAGEPLDSRLERGALLLDEALVLGQAIAGALGAAHARGLVHRDVKPANIFLPDGDVARAKLLDFGLTRDTMATFGLTGTGDLLGTPLYMSPEQASCELDIDARCDIYALGAVLYTCLAGRPPLLAPNLPGLLAKIVLEEPPPLPKAPSAIASLVMRMLAKKRGDRPANGDEAMRAIEAAATDVSLGARPSAAAVVPAREQRVVSILLATHAREALQLDATRDSYGGVLALADGSTMVVFSGPETPGDLAARAARYALGLRTPAGVVSLATGRALLSGPTPMGEVIDRAAGQLGAPVGSVRVDADTAALLEGRFELAADGDGALLVGERAGELDPVRTLLGKPTRCIGRDRELAAIEGYFAECVGESNARAVIVIADAGIGKSRLANELQRRLAQHSEAPQILVARCESITERSPFAAVAAALRRAASISPDDSAVVRASKLSTLLARSGASDAQVAEFLGEVLMNANPEPSERMRAARENPVVMFDHIRTAWISWLTTLCERNPLLLVIEDLHWADASSVLLVDAALAALVDQRFMVLALARPEARDRKPWVARRPHEMRLDPLAKRASERLVRDALGELATDEIVAGILARAEGNALFLEELVRAAANPNVGALPVGVIGTLQLRFDSLRAETRTVLRIASVFGERFSHTGIAALVPAALDVGAALDELVAAELVGRSADGYAFRHALVREAAYALLPEADRKIAHAHAAQVLAAESDADPSVVGRHFELGDRLQDSARWYALAAERALLHNDLGGAIAYALKAQTWLEDPTRLGALDLLIAETEMWRGRLADAIAAALRASHRLTHASSEWLYAVGLIITASGQLGDNNSVLHWLDEVIELEVEPEALEALVLALARASSQLAWGDRTEHARRALARADALAHGHDLGPLARARLEFARGYDFYIMGVVDRCCDQFHIVEEMYARVGARRDALQARLIRLTLGMMGAVYENPLAELFACIEQAQQLDATYIAEWARYEYAASLLIAGRRTEGELAFSRVAEVVLSTPLFRAGRILITCWAAFVDDDPERMREILDTQVSAGPNARYEAAIAAFHSWLRLKRGEHAAAEADARVALELLRTSPGITADIQSMGVPIALTVLAETNAPDVAHQMRVHVSRIAAAAARFATESAGERFEHRLPWNAAVQRLAKRYA